MDGLLVLSLAVPSLPTSSPRVSVPGDWPSAGLRVQPRPLRSPPTSPARPPELLSRVPRGPCCPLAARGAPGAGGLPFYAPLCIKLVLGSVCPHTGSPTRGGEGFAPRRGGQRQEAETLPAAQESEQIQWGSAPRLPWLHSIKGPRPRWAEMGFSELFPVGSKTEVSLTTLRGQPWVCAASS